MPNCSHCNTTNQWNKCPSCGNVMCNSCGYDRSGNKRRATNVCPGCNKTVQMIHCGANP